MEFTWNCTPAPNGEVMQCFVDLIIIVHLLPFQGSAFRNLYGHTVSVLDQQLNADVARQLLEEFPINTKTDLLLESAKDGAVSILRKWPDFKSKLHLCLNQALPDTLREISWKLYLDNPKGKHCSIIFLKI